MSIVQAVDYHVPVMLEECLEGMNLQPTGHYVDVTFGGGGHSRAILDRLSDGGHLYSFDQDPDAAARAEETERFTFVASNFRHLERSWTTMKSWGRWMRSWLTSVSPPITSMIWSVALASVMRRLCWICA